MSGQSATPAPFWRPTEDGSRLLMMWLGIAVGVIGAIALALSFVSVDQAAVPYFGRASWAIPVLMDSTIGVLTFFSIVAELNRLSSPMARYTARALVALTVYANVAPQPSVYGKILHGAPPTVWVLIVMVAEGIIRRLMGLSDDKRIEPMRKVLFVLRPWPTWRLWRRMRVEQITTYQGALDRDAARSAVVGRLQLHHGRLRWRSRAPLAERIALTLQGRDPAGVAQALGDHAQTVALLQASTTAPQAVCEPAPMPLDPVIYPRAERIVLAPFSGRSVPFTGQGSPFAPDLRTLPPGTVAGAARNAPENDEDAAARLRAEGLSYQQIADRLGRSKSWAHATINGRPVEHANGSAP